VFGSRALEEAVVAHLKVFESLQLERDRASQETETVVRVKMTDVRIEEIEKGEKTGDEEIALDC
jgi:hypothetical protein